MTRFSHPTPLRADQLSPDIGAEDLNFETTADLEPLHGMLGQVRAQKALAFGLAMRRPGYNIYLAGETGTGRLSFAIRYLETRAIEDPAPWDWLYLNNCEDPRTPIALGLPAGRGKALLAAMECFIDNLLATFPAAFEHPAYQRHRRVIDREFQQRYDSAIRLVERRAQSENIALFRNEEVVSFTPLIDGKPADEESFAALPEDDKDAFHRQARELEDYLGEVLAELPQWRRENADALRRLDQETIDAAIEPLLHPLRQDHAELPEVLVFLDRLRADLPPIVAQHLAEGLDESARRASLTECYAPRLLVPHPPEAGAPVVYETNPSDANLFGRIEYVNIQGTLTTHHRLIYPGALHRANGGYLILEAEKVFAGESAWPALKRALQSGEIRIEPPGEDPSVIAMTLAPETIPLSVKLLLVGPRELYDLLQRADPEFDELFRVLAEFDDHLPRTPEAMLDFARLVKTHADADGCAPLTAAAIARLIVHSTRLAEHQDRLSARLREIFELAAEADVLRLQGGFESIDAPQVCKALAAKNLRLGRTRELLLEEILAGTLLIDTGGTAVGGINGLIVLEVGGQRFGLPARITATVYPGSRGVVDIEREAQLGQAIHSKGVMILAGCLGRRYARGFPLAMSANLALEQSYGIVDGDSASLAELCVLISALTGIPLAQTHAVTGSINQHGEVQAVGGVNEKIEGFFALCKARGLSGRQGVIIPQANVCNLVLSAEIVEAVRQGLFAIRPVESLDQTLEILTGKPMASVDRIAVSKLRSMARQALRDR